MLFALSSIMDFNDLRYRAQGMSKKDFLSSVSQHFNELTYLDNGSLSRGESTMIPSLDDDVAQPHSEDFSDSSSSTSSTTTATELKPITLAAITEKEEKFFLNEDIVVMIMTHSRRHSWMRLVRRSWGRFIKNLYIFSDTEDETVPTIKLKSPFPYHNSDVRQTWFPNAVLPVLVNLSKTLDPPPSFFINLDDDTFPLLDKIQNWIASYRSTYQQNFPYLVGQRSGTRTGPKFAEFKEQVDLVETVFKKSQISFMPGHLYGFNTQFLEDVAPHALTCPVLRPSDFNMGGLMYCSRIGMKATEIGRRDAASAWNNWSGSRVGVLDLGYNTTTTATRWREHFYYHHNSAILLAYRLYYEGILGLSPPNNFPSSEDKTMWKQEQRQALPLQF